MGKASQELIVKNSIVYDAKNKIAGEKNDILVSNGRIVDILKDEQSAQEVDANGCISFPGFIDLRTHFFAQETMYHQILFQSHKTRLEHSTIMDVERAALNQGFTFLCEMDVPITQSKITLHNMGLSPILDHAMIMDIGSNWSFLGDLESESAIDNIGNTISMLLGLVKGYGISTNCPYHQQYWKMQEIPLNSKIPMIPLKALQIYNLLVNAALKNSIRTHFVSPYGKEDPSANQMEILKGIEQACFTLATTNQYFSDKFTDFVQYHSTHDDFSCEITPISLGSIHPLITRDRNLALRESKNSGIPMTTVDLEFDTEYYVTGRKLDSNNPYSDNWIQMVWDLKKNSDLNRVALSSNTPYNMSTMDWSKHIYDLLTKTQNDIGLLEISALLSANPAKILDISDIKGHLGIGADADIICFNTDPEKITEKSFSDTKIIVKNGQLVKEKSTYAEQKSPLGKIFWTEGEFDASSMKKTKKKKERFYDKRFSMYLNALENGITPNMEKR